jgi:hypothetical protein
MSDQNPKKKLTRKRLNNALVQVYKNHPTYFTSPPTKMSFFQHVYAGNLDDVQEFIEEPDFNINMRDTNGNGCLFFAMDGFAGLPMVKLLLKNGADINMMNHAGEVPFHVLSRHLQSLSQNQLEILEFLIQEDELILFPFFGRSMEEKFLEAIENIESFDQWYLDAPYIEAEVTPEDEEAHDHQMRLLRPLMKVYETIVEISQDNEHYVNVIPYGTKQRMYHHLDTRMTGAQLKQYIQRQVYKNPSMNLDFMFQGKPLDPYQRLAEQGVVGDVTITFQVRLVSGVLPRRGGKQTTRRKRLRK